jgi:hypothetical protein
MDSKKETTARAALHDLGLEIADRWVSGFEKRPTTQLVLQKLIDPIVRHILNSIFPWIVGVAICFLILLICTVLTCVIVLRTPGVASVPSGKFQSAVLGCLPNS